MLPSENQAGPIAPPAAPPRRLWLLALIGGFVAFAAAVVAIMLVAAPTAPSDLDREMRAVDDPPRPPAPTQPPGPTRVEPPTRNTTADAAGLRLLDEIYAQLHHGQHASRDDQLAWLDREYERALDRQRLQIDPDAVFAVDIARAVAAGQVEGPSTALVTIVKAWDYGCGFCRRISTTLDDLRKQYGDDIRVVYLTMVVHPQVALAHSYSCAAAIQGKFVDFHHEWWPSVFDGPYQPDKFTEPKLIAFGRKLKLDITKLKSDAASDACQQRVAEDRDELNRFRVNATPTFFVNGRYLAGAFEPGLRALVEEEWKRAKSSGVASADYYANEVFAKGARQFKTKTGNGPPTRADAFEWLKKTYGNRVP